MKTLNGKPRRAPKIVVRTLSPRQTRGVLTYGNLRFPCALGKTGRRVGKREGDNASPMGDFPLRAVFYRSDRVVRPRTALPLSPVRHDDGWCDAPGDRNYNRPVRHPYPASAERMWRSDGLYDLVVVLGHNDRPRIKGRGSAVFMHVARPGLAPTEGCIALERPHLQRLLATIRRRTLIRIPT